MTEFTVTLGNRPEPDAEEARMRALRAREVLVGAGWAFDERISELTRDLLGTRPDEADKRESLYHQIDATAQLKGHLSRIIELQQAKERVNERAERARKPADAE